MSDEYKQKQSPEVPDMPARSRSGLVGILRNIIRIEKEDPYFTSPRVKQLKYELRRLIRDLGKLQGLDRDVTWPPEIFQRYQEVVDTAKRLGCYPD